jgi:PAS domain S-box-containing protein
MNRIRLITFPRDDAAFEAHVRVASDFTGTADLDGFVSRLRSAYPLARVSAAMPAARLDPTIETWYVYRDGSIHARRGDDAWADNPGAARAVLGPDGTYADANEAAAALFGVRRDAIIGQRAGSFTQHEPDPAIGDALLELARRSGRLRSTAVVARPDGQQWPIEFVVRSLRDGHQTVTMRRLDIEIGECPSTGARAPVLDTGGA